MTSTIGTILIVGATSGIGEAFARRFHSMGKKVIIAGRRVEKLTAISGECPGMETHELDITDFAALPEIVSSIITTYPNLDTVFLNAGIQQSFSLLDPSTTNSDAIAREVNTNLTAPILLSRLFLPYLLARAEEGNPSSLFITSSSLAFVPMGFYPVYCPTKAAMHSFCIALRQQLSHASTAAQENFRVVEIVPPYVDTELDAEHRAMVTMMQGGPEKAFPPMPLPEFIEKIFAALEEGESGNKVREVGVGFGAMGIEMWRGSVGKLLEGMGMDC